MKREALKEIIAMWAALSTVIGFTAIIIYLIDNVSPWFGLTILIVPILYSIEYYNESSN
jgi:hypothetical protein